MREDGGALLVVFTVVEIVALVGVLAAFLVLYRRQVLAIADELRDASRAVGALERDLQAIPTAARDVNAVLDEIAGDLPRLTECAEQRTARG